MKSLHSRPSVASLRLWTVWLLVFTAGQVTVAAQSTAWIETRLATLRERYAAPDASRAEVLGELLRETEELLAAGKIQRGDLQLLRSRILLRQGNWSQAWTAVEESLQGVDERDYAPTHAARLDQLAFLLTLHREEYAYPIALRERIRGMLPAYSPTSPPDYAEVTVNNLIRLADLYDRTGKEHLAEALILEARERVGSLSLDHEQRFQVELFRVHRYYRRNALRAAEDAAHTLLSVPKTAAVSDRGTALLYALYGKIQLGLGRLQAAENALRQAEQLLATNCDGLAYERTEILTDLATVYQRLGRHAAARVLWEQLERSRAQPGSGEVDARLADFYHALAGARFLDYQRLEQPDPTHLLEALAYNLTARRHAHRHARILSLDARTDFDRQWSRGTRKPVLDQTIALYCAAYELTGEKRYFYETVEILDHARYAFVDVGAPPPRDSTAWMFQEPTLRERLTDPIHGDLTLVRYVSASDRLYLLAWSERGAVFVPLAAEALELKDQIARLRQALLKNPARATAEDRERLALHAHNLYQLLLAPVEDIAGERLLIITDEALAELPFSLLLSAPTPPEIPYAAWPFALKKYSFTYDNSPFLGPEARSTETTGRLKKGVLAFAPEFEPGFLRADTLRSVGRLPGNVAEAEYLTERFAARAFTGPEADLAAFQRWATRYEILHLATHATTDAEDGTAGYLSFSPGKEGRLISAATIARLGITAEMVVLSTCDSGLGEWQAGAGVVGVGNAFLRGGAKSVITTYWKVSDRASARFMPLFYERLDQGLPKDVALRRAQLDFISQGPAWLAHPFFWAGYVHQGSTTPVALRAAATGPWWIGGMLFFALLVFWRLSGTFTSNRTRADALKH